MEMKIETIGKTLKPFRLEIKLENEREMEFIFALLCGSPHKLAELLNFNKEGLEIKDFTAEDIPYALFENILNIINDKLKPRTKEPLMSYTL